MQTDHIAFYYWLRILFVSLASVFALSTIAAYSWKKRWKRVLLDAFVYFALFPLWLLFGAALLALFPCLVYSWFPALWFVSGALLWPAFHIVMTVLAVKKKERFDATCSAAGICAIGCFIAFIHFWDMTKNV